MSSKRIIGQGLGSYKIGFGIDGQGDNDPVADASADAYQTDRSSYESCSII